jgi:hypothetical protein
MSKRKSHWTCSYCSKILKDPILLPCGDSICNEHLSERDVKENKMKCNDCQQEFQIKDIQFKSNKTLKKLTESQSYLNEDELSLKLELEETIGKLFQIYDEIKQNKTKPQLLVSNHFEQIRSQIDQHRDKLTNRIDCIALKIKDETKYYEQIYFKSIKESFSSFNQSKGSLEDKLTEIEETFRNPNLLIQTIKEMQQKHEESLKEIQSKLNQMTKIKDNLEATNEFKPNSSFLRQVEDTSLFGSIRLFGFTNLDLFKSQIQIEGNQQSIDSLCNAIRCDSKGGPSFGEGPDIQRGNINNG